MNERVTNGNERGIIEFADRVTTNEANEREEDLTPAFG